MLNRKRPKPHFKRSQGEWLCLGGKVGAKGSTLAEAFARWQWEFDLYWAR